MLNLFSTAKCIQNCIHLQNPSTNQAYVCSSEETFDLFLVTWEIGVCFPWQSVTLFLRWFNAQQILTENDANVKETGKTIENSYCERYISFDDINKLIFDRILNTADTES